MEVKKIRKQKISDFINKDWDTFLLQCALLNPQSYGATIEKKFIVDNNLRKNKSSDNIGDVYNSLLDRNYEIKASYLSKDNTYNLVQIRSWQDVDYYIMLIDISDEKVNKTLFILSHQEMCYEIENYGDNAHGTKSILKENNKVEKRLTLTNNDIERWKKMYYHQDDFILRDKNE